MNSTSSRDTPNPCQHVEQFPLKKTQKLAEQILHIRQTNKVTLKQVGAADTESHYKTHSQLSDS